jgi:hypothetical protein
MVDEQPLEQNQLTVETRQERRSKQQTKKKAKMPQHGKSLARVYRNAVSRRAGGTEREKQSR